MSEQDPLFDLPEPPPPKKERRGTSPNGAGFARTISKLPTIPLEPDAELARCKFCNRLIWKWGVTKNGKHVPVDHTSGSQTEGINHWLRCSKRHEARAYFSKR